MKSPDAASTAKAEYAKTSRKDAAGRVIYTNAGEDYVRCRAGENPGKSYCKLVYMRARASRIAGGGIECTSKTPELEKANGVLEAEIAALEKTNVSSSFALFA